MIDLLLTLFSIGFLLIFFILIWFISTITITIANSNLKKYRKDDNAPEDLKNAATYTYYATIISWLAFSLLIAGAVIAIVGFIIITIFGGEFVEGFELTTTAAKNIENKSLGKEPPKNNHKFIKFIFYPMIFLFIGLSFSNGLLGIYAFRNFMNYVSDTSNEEIDEQSRIRTSLLVTIIASLGSIGLLFSFIISKIISLIINNHAKKIKVVNKN